MAPETDECAVLSLLAARDGEAWSAVAGSMVSFPVEVGEMSWPRWSETQPATGRPKATIRDDLGPIFDERAFSDLRILRAVIDRDAWERWVEEIGAGRLDSCGEPVEFSFDGFSAIKLLTQDRQSEAHQVLESQTV